MVEPRYDIALTEARNIDQMIASKSHSKDELEKLYPLLGVPITIKESIAVAGNFHYMILNIIFFYSIKIRNINHQE